MDLKLTKSEYPTKRFYWGGDKKNMWIELNAGPAMDVILPEMRRQYLNGANLSEVDWVSFLKSDERRCVNMALKCLVNWGNFTVEGEGVGCTQENKIMLFEQVDGFMGFYMSKLTELLAEALRELFKGNKRNTALQAMSNTYH